MKQRERDQLLDRGMARRSGCGFGRSKHLVRKVRKATANFLLPGDRVLSTPPQTHPFWTLRTVHGVPQQPRWVVTASWVASRALMPSARYAILNVEMIRSSRSGVDNGGCQDQDANRSPLYALPAITHSGLYSDVDLSVTFISFSIILTSVLLEFVDYRRIQLEPSIMVDRSRGEKLVIEMDVTFPRVPCYRALHVAWTVCLLTAVIVSTLARRDGHHWGAPNGSRA